MDGFDDYQYEERPPDVVQEEAERAVRVFFDERRDRVFSSRQVEVHFERQYFHWITHRVLKNLRATGYLEGEITTLAHGAPISLFWHRSHRYTRRPVRELLRLVEQYSDPDFTAALGNTGELLVGDGFARFGFLQRGRETRRYEGRGWEETEHDLDFIFERDGRVYGVEVKNTLPYITDGELRIKVRMCKHLGIVPVFVVRAMPAIWIQEVNGEGGFTLVLRHQLYPLSHRAFAAEVREGTGLPVDAPRALYDGTMQRFSNWHERQLAAR